MGKTMENCTMYNVVLPEPPPKDYKYVCEHPKCGKAFTKQSRLKMHENTHLSEKPFKCSYENCDSAYYQKNHLKRHEATRHSQPGGEYKCTIEGCIASFSSSSSLYFHGKRKHGVRKFKCSFCEEMFSKKFLLRHHEYTHADCNIFKCSRQDCSETFSTEEELKAHRKIHKKQSRIQSQNTDIQVTEPILKTYKCKTCEQIFSKWSEIVAHRKVHLPSNKVACPICNKMLSKHSMNLHQKTHEDVIKKVAYACPYEGCDRFYYHTKNLNYHIQHAHEDSSKFECQICNQKLSTKQKLEQHIKTLHEKPSEIKSKINTFSREKLIKKLCGAPEFSVKRRGPPLKYGLKKRPFFQDTSPSSNISSELFPDSLQINVSQLTKQPECIPQETLS